jgi:ketosteroid isomerase-like protein
MHDDQSSQPIHGRAGGPTRRRLTAGLLGGAVAALGMAHAAGATAGHAAATPAGDGEGVDEAVARTRAVTADFLNGDPEPWKATCSHADDATLFGGWGGHERGWNELGARYDWAAARYEGGEVEFEEIARHVDGDLAATVHYERSRAQLAGVAGPVPVALRVTHLYRREEGTWKLLHRHADPLVALQTTESVVDE